MKTPFIIPILFLFNFTYSQQVDLINEDFNDGFPSNWTHYYSSWGGEQWAVDSGALKEASGPYFTPVSNRIELPAVDFTSVSAPSLEFDLAMAVIDTNVQFSIYYTTDSTWNPLLTFTDTSTAISIHTSHDNNWKPLITDYQTISVDLSQFDNEPDVRFSFVYGYLNAWASGVWYIDNVKVFGSPFTGISKHPQSLSFQLFPNPTSSIIHFIPNNPVKNATLKITSITGKLFLEKVIDSDIEEIDLSAYPPGIYSVHYTHMNRTHIETLIVH